MSHVPMKSALAVVIVAFASCGDNQAAPAVVDAAAIDGPAVDAPMIDAPAIDAAAIDAPAIDAPAIDAPAIDAVPIDAPIDAIPIDGPPIVQLPQLVPDPTFAGDGIETLPGETEPNAVSTSGPRIGLCGTYRINDQGQLFAIGMWAYRTTPGASETLSGSLLANPPTTQYPRGCQRHALFPDGQATFVVDAGFPFTATWLMRRESNGTLTAPQPGPQVGVSRGLHPLASHGVVVIYDEAAWVYDAALQLVPTVGVGGRIALPGPVRFTLLRPGERLDVVTPSQVLRYDLATGTLDPTFGIGGAVALPGPALTIRGAAPLPDGSALVVGVGAGVVISPTGVATRVTLPAIDPQVVVEDRAGGVYFITTGPMFMSTAVLLTQVAPSTPTSWETGTVSTIMPDNLGGFLDSALGIGAAWTSADRLAVVVRLTHLAPGDFFYTRRTGLLVLRR